MKARSICRPLASRLAFIAAVACGAVFSAATGANAASPFSSLNGSWSGGGSANFEGGKSEKLRCSAFYNGAGDTKLSLSIRCASPGSKIELRSNLTHSSGRLSGSWEERTFNLSGGVTGSSTASSMRLRFTGGVGGTLTISVGKGSQHVSLSAGGSSFRGATMSFARR